MKNISIIRGKKKNEKVKNGKGQCVSNYAARMLLDIQFLLIQLFTFSDDPDEYYNENLDMIKYWCQNQRNTNQWLHVSLSFV